MTKKIRNWLIALSILAFPFVLFFGFLIFMEEPLPPVAPLPNPNGYDDLVNAGKTLPNVGSGYDKMNQQQLQKAVSANATVVALARAALSNQCLVPVQYTESYISNHLDDLTSLKQLARAFAAEGRLAEMENRTNDAIKAYLDTIHFANESARGGVLIDGLVGIAIESIGVSHLTNLVGHLDAKSCRETAAALETLDAQRQTWDEVMRQEHDWSGRTFNSLRDKIFWPLLAKMAERAYAKPEINFKKQQTETRQLLIALATRSYELDKGHPPASASDLVPEYLKAVPQDPFTGANLVYSPR
jgi:hypothetical protein